MSSFSFTLLSGGSPSTTDDTDGEYTLNENHQQEMVDNLIDLFKKPRNQGVVEAVSDQIQELENAIYECITGYYLPTAEAAQLDVLGKIVMEDRQGRSDNDYRAAIGVRILVNRSNGRLNELIAIGAAMTGSTPYVQEQYPAAIKMRFPTLGTVSLRTVYSLLRQAKAGGVRLFLSYGPRAVGAVDGNPLGGKIGAVDGNPAGFKISGGT